MQAQGCCMFGVVCQFAAEDGAGEGGRGDGAEGAGHTGEVERDVSAAITSQTSITIGPSPEYPAATGQAPPAPPQDTRKGYPYSLRRLFAGEQRGAGWGFVV